MGRFWHRKKDPHNIEELMVSEHQRLLAQLDERDDKIEQLQIEATQKSQAHFDELMAAQQHIISLEKRLQDVLSQTSGVTDCHEPTLLYYLTCESAWYIKDYLDAPELIDKINLITKLLNLPHDKTLVKEALKMQCGSKTLVGIEERTFPYKLSVKTVGNIATLYFDPENSLKELVQASNTPKLDRWCLVKIDECIPVLARELRSNLRSARSRLQEKLQEEQDD